ncbi:MAG: YitT family protein [Clostridiaceae bacterium]
MKISIKQRDMAKYFILAAAGMALFAIGLNYFIQPLKFYSGGVVGIAQIIRSALIQIGFPLPAFDVSGIIYYLINIPLLVLAWRSLGRFFFVRTIIMTTLLTVFLTVVPIPIEPLIHDKLTAALVGGVICGTGTGLCLFAGYSAGGMDVLGLYFTQKFPDFSIGKIALIVNVFVFSVLALTQNFETVVFSFLFNAVISVAIDKVHAQNINVWVIIFTKKPGIDQAIMKNLGRGVTNWEGAGAYTGEATHIHTTMINKVEIPLVRRMVLSIDPKAFIISTEGSQAVGNFQRRL